MEWPEPEYGVSEAKDDRGKIRGRMGILEILQIGHWVVGGSEVNCQLLTRSLGLQTLLHLWMECPEPEYEPSGMQDGRVKITGRMRSYHYIRQK